MGRKTGEGPTWTKGACFACQPQSSTSSVSFSVFSCPVSFPMSNELYFSCSNLLQCLPFPSPWHTLRWTLLSLSLSALLYWASNLLFSLPFHHTHISLSPTTPCSLMASTLRLWSPLHKGPRLPTLMTAKNSNVNLADGQAKEACFSPFGWFACLVVVLGRVPGPCCSAFCPWHHWSRRR